MYCPKCGKENIVGANFCGSCGAGLHPSPKEPAGGHNVAATPTGTRGQPASTELVYPKNPPHSPHLCWLNLILQGLAQMIHGQVSKGVSILIAQLVIVSLLPPLAIVTAIASIYDAYKVGFALKMGRPIGKWAWFPDATQTS